MVQCGAAASKPRLCRVFPIIVPDLKNVQAGHWAHRDPTGPSPAAHQCNARHWPSQEAAHGTEQPHSIASR